MKSPLVKCVGVVVLAEAEDVQAVAGDLMHVLARYGVQARLYNELEPLVAAISGLDLVMTVGGDGTMLSCSALVARQGIPLAGVNMGRLGFMTSCAMTQMDALASAITTGEYELSERTMISVQQFDEQGESIAPARIALNEVTLWRGPTGKMTDVDVLVDESVLTRYHADGILVSTPTGSTAYSLSAGGPLVWPNAPVLCITPICPHSLTNRSIVLPDSVCVKLRPRPRRGRHEAMAYSLDGRQTYDVAVGQELRIVLAQERLQLLSLEPLDFGSLLRNKLRWQNAEITDDEE